LVVVELEQALVMMMVTKVTIQYFQLLHPQVVEKVVQLIHLVPLNKGDQEVLVVEQEELLEGLQLNQEDRVILLQSAHLKVITVVME
jgi:hypothetical protein